MLTFRAGNALTVMLAVVTLVAAGEPSLSWAHAFPSAEEPKVGSTIDKSPAAVVITFDNPIEALFAKLEVLDSNGQDERLGSPSVADDRRHLSVSLKPLPAGDYTVKWSVVAEDGHRTEGSYQFTLTAAGP